jgi:proline iminopeptidase
MMRNRPTVVLIHGGPGSYDHSYFKPDFAPLARRAQVIYLDLRDHGRSARHDPADWSFELCADDKSYGGNHANLTTTVDVVLAMLQVDDAHPASATH